jgi:ABC-type Na+ efflux pump permease subunit
MSKILVVASSEFSSAVRTKAFIIGVGLMPVLIAGLVLLQTILAKQVDRDDRAFAVIDRSGALYAALEAKAAARNADLSSDPKAAAQGPRFLPSPARLDGKTVEDLRLELSTQVREKRLFAFVEVPPGVLDAEGAEGERILYYSDSPTYDDLRRWVEGVLNDEIRSHRFRAASIDRDLVARLDRRVAVDNLGLAGKAAGGSVEAARKVDRIRTLGVPLALMFLLFMVVMSSAPLLLNSVIEEKMSRISEVLLGSVTPFELMMGKLLGSVGVSCLLAALYLGGGFAAAAYLGYADLVPLVLFFWFILFLVLAVLLFGSFFIAIGAACTEIRDAQSLMTPGMLILMLPLFTWNNVARAPDSTFSTAVSLFPPATPLLMLLRLSIPPGPPLWQIILSVFLTTAATAGCVWAAGKIFRTGILMQGKSASLRELVRWVLAR